MNDLSFLRDFVIIFSAAIAINFLFHRLRIAPIVGYLMAGVLLGPSMFGVVNDMGLIEGAGGSRCNFTIVFDRD